MSRKILFHRSTNMIAKCLKIIHKKTKWFKAFAFILTVKNATNNFKALKRVTQTNT